MNETEALKLLARISAKHQEVLVRLAQEAPAPQGEDLTAKLQEALFAVSPQARSVLLEGPNVGTSADEGAKMVVSYKYRSGGGKNGPILRQLIEQAANTVLGQGKFLLQGTGVM